jgi:hypothetical protein
MNSDSLRTVEVLTVYGYWIGIEFKDIKEGDLIRLFEPTGEPVKGLGGKTEFRALSDTYIDIEHDVYTFAMKEE